MATRKLFPCVFFWAVIVGFILLLSGCLQDYLPHLKKVKEVEEVQPAEEEAEQWLEESLPPGVLYPRIYLVEGKGNYLLPVTVSLPWTEGVARATLKKLIEGPTPAQEMRYGLHSPLSPNTQVLGLSIREGLAKLDLNAAFLDYDPGEEELVLNSVLFTLLQFPAVNSVQLLIEGIAPETFPGGTPVEEEWGPEEGINLEMGDDPLDLEKNQAVTLYFCTALGENDIFYVPITRYVSAERNTVEAAIEELFKGPLAGSSLFSDLPTSVQLRNFVLLEGILTVDLSKEILNYRGGGLGEKNMLMQVVLTLTEIPGVDKVQLLVAGEKMKLPYGTSCQKPLAQPLMVNPLFSALPGGGQDGLGYPDMNGLGEEE